MAKRTIEKLTAAEVRNAKAENGKDLWMADGGGLFLHVRPWGQKTWRLRYTVNGHRRIMDLGRASDLSLKQARLLAREARLGIAQGVDPLEERELRLASREAERRALEARTTLADAAKQWADIALTGPAGPDRWRRIQKDVLSRLGERDITSIRRGDLVACLDAVQARGSMVSANRLLSDLKQFFGWAEVREIVPANPLRGVKKTREVSRDRVLSEAEIVELRDKLPSSGLPERIQAAVWILLATGARVGELLRARWDDVELEAGCWLIPAEHSKNGRAHTIYLSAFAMRHFRRLYGLTGWSQWVMPSSRKGGPLGLKTITRLIRDRMRQEPLKGRSKAAGSLVLAGGPWRPHDLRRTAATMMAAAGISPEVVECCLNHAEPVKIRTVYQRYSREPEQRHAWSMLGQRLDELLAGREQKIVPIRR